MTTDRRPRYLTANGHPVGWNPPAGPRTSTHRHHAVGCRVDGGDRTHGMRGFRCLRCATTADITVERLLEQLEKAQPAGSR